MRYFSCQYDRHILNKYIRIAGANHFPYIPLVWISSISMSLSISFFKRFPPSWPIWTPAPKVRTRTPYPRRKKYSHILFFKLANWLESYAEAMELNVWTGITVNSLKQDVPVPGRLQTWTVEVKHGNDAIRTLRPRHVVFAHGWGGGVPKVPKIPGMVCIISATFWCTFRPLSSTLG